MPTRFSSLGITGAVTIGGLLTAGVIALTTLTATTGTFTTLRTQTLSGATIAAMQANGVVKAQSLSGTTITINKTGTASLVLRGSAGGRICMPNTSGTMYVLVLTGAGLVPSLRVRSAQGTECLQ